MKCSTCILENFAPMEKDCSAYSTDGKVSPENEHKIWLDTEGAFGQPIPGREAELLRLYRKEM